MIAGIGGISPTDWRITGGSRPHKPEVDETDDDPETENITISNREGVAMSAWEIVTPLVSKPRQDLRRDFTPDAHLEVPFGGHAPALLGLHVYCDLQGPVTEETDKNELTRGMIAKTREALAAMEASLKGRCA